MSGSARAQRALLIFILAVLIAFISGVPVFCESRYGGVLIYGTMGQPLSLDPGTINDSESALVASNIFDTLVNYNSSADKLSPSLATGWEASSDKKIWTFQLRKGVKFHDGTPFNAQAVKFSWERQISTSHPYHNPAYGRFTFYRSLWGGYPGNIREIKVIDDYKVQVYLNSKEPGFLKIISSIQFSIISPRAVISYKDEFYMNPVGTGAFKFKEWRPWHRVVLLANKDYWKGRPYLDKLIFEPTPGEHSRMRQIKRQRIDATENPSDEVYSQITSGKVPHLKIQLMPGENFSFLLFNCQKPPFDNPLVRKAVCLAINKKQFEKYIGGSRRAVASPFDMLWGVNISGKDDSYNPAMARALLKKAGYPNGFRMELWYLQLSRPYLINPESTARAIAADLRGVKIKAEIKGVKWENYLEKVSFGDYQTALSGYVGIDDNPELYFKQSWDRNNAILGGTNHSFYRNDKFRALLKEAAVCPDRQEKAEIFGQMQRIIDNECLIFPLYTNQTYLVTDKKVYGLVPSKDGTIDFSRAWVDN